MTSYCRWKVYSNLGMPHEYSCIQCCANCEKKCSSFCRSKTPCNLKLTEVEYLMIKLARKPLEKLEEEGLIRIDK